MKRLYYKNHKNHKNHKNQVSGRKDSRSNTVVAVIVFCVMLLRSGDVVAVGQDASSNSSAVWLKNAFKHSWVGIKRVSLSAESHSQSEPVSVLDWANKWQGDFQSGEQAYSFNRAQLLVEYHSGFRIGWQTRYDYVTRFNDATARLYYDNQNAMLSETPRTDIFLYAQHLRAAGVTFGMRFPLRKRLHLTVDVTRLRAHDLIQGDIAGQVSINAETDFLVDADVDYAYQQDDLFDRPGTDATLGWGWALDLSLVWQIDAHWHAQLNIVDAWNRVDWHRTPFTRASIDTIDKISDEGTISLDPAVAGFEGFRDQRQRLPVRANGLVSRRFNSGMRTHVAWRKFPIESVIEWGIDYPLSHDASDKVKHEIGISFVAPVDAVEVRQRYGALYWALSMDNVEISDAHWVSAELGIAWSF